MVTTPQVERKHLPVSTLVLFGLGALLGLGTMTASASLISSIPSAINESLLGNTSLFAARAILTASIMVMVALPLGMMRRMTPIGIVMVLLCVLGSLTAIGWADITFLIIACLSIVAMFGAKIVDRITPGGG